MSKTVVKCSNCGVTADFWDEPMSEDLPAERTEAQITEEIFALQDRLTVLYAQRRGRCILRTADQKPGVWAWCVGCGQYQVNTSEGEDTCPACLKLR